MNANSNQVAGSHYRSALQHWDYVLLALGNRYFEGNITKYVVRHRKKNGRQDLEKALHYIDKLTELARQGQVAPLEVVTDYDIHAFIAANGLNSNEAFIVKRLAYWVHENHLHEARAAISLLIGHAIEEERRLEAIKAGSIPFGEALRIEGAGSGYVNQDR